MKTKVLIIILALTLLPTVVSARQKDNKIPDARIDAIIREFRLYDGVMSMSFGPFVLSMGRSALRIAGNVSSEDKDEMDLVRHISRGVKRVSFVICEDCEQRIKDRLIRRLDRALSSCEPLLEVREDGTVVRVHGVVSSNGRKIKDLLLFVGEPSEPVLIRIKGNIDVQEVMDLILDYAA